MPNAFATISFTESVKAAQTRYGSRESNLRFEYADDPRNELGDFETKFISERDSFYQATTSGNGWPYVQHRGGPKGFLSVLDARTIGYADFKGNRQYISVGNLNSNTRISLILMDYTNRHRLKIWGTARIIHEEDHPELLASLEVSSYRASVERGVVIRIEAFEWNCPQHITPRFTEAEMDSALQPLLEENQQLKSKVSLQTTSGSNALGEGELHLVITAVRQLTSSIRAYELKAPDDKPLPKVSAGAHIKVPVQLADGTMSVRHYSICSNPEQNNRYEIAVLSDENGNGGSLFVHKHYQVGTHLKCEAPRNHFVLDHRENTTILIAGGIGITPIMAMARTLKSQGKVFQFHYVGHSFNRMAYVEVLQSEFGELLNIYTKQQPLDLMKTMSCVTGESHFYVCGPERLVAGVQQTAMQLGIAEDRVHFERFSNSVLLDLELLEVELARSKTTLAVASTQSILEAAEEAGIHVVSDCKVGSCGMCAVDVLEGNPQHLDSVLTERERSLGKMCICVSRAHSAKLVLDV